jgi:hypothetical protein
MKKITTILWILFVLVMLYIMNHIPDGKDDIRSMVKQQQQIDARLQLEDAVENFNRTSK